MAFHYVNSDVDQAIDKIGEDSSSDKDQALVASLWDRTFCSYPPEMVVRLPYYFAINSTIAFNTLGVSNQFKVNSIYDFDLSGAGHQPLGRDTWAGIYDYYKVMETRATLTWHSMQYVTGATAQTSVGTVIDGNPGSGYMAPTYVGAMLDITANPPTTLTNWQEASMVTGNSQQRFSKIQKLERIGSRPGTTRTVSMTWKPDMFDTAVLFDATQNTWTPVGSDPANLNYLTDIIYNANSTNNTVSYSFEVHAEMLVAFKNVNRSLLLTTN